MLRDPETRRKLALFGIVLGVIGSIGVIWSVAAGGAEIWSLIILIPVFAVISRLGRLVGQITEKQVNERREKRRDPDR
ncbi:MAG: hypothetical protein EA415_13400 [Sphaerobacteraceae bacterium]|nr:MAG: hypothetical protein EA415_13400 [Sphaerobacteraceae bacterium]